MYCHVDGHIQAESGERIPEISRRYMLCSRRGGCILPQILGSLPEVIRSWCAHHHHHHKVFARPFGVERSLSRLNRPSLLVAGPGKRHSDSRYSYCTAF